MLHIVSALNTLKSCMREMQDADSVLFIGEGVYDLAEFPNATTYVLAEDAELRGIHVPDSLKKIDYDGFVDLVTQTSASVTWT